MTKVNLDLGETYPSSPSAVVMDAAPKERKHYPQFTYTVEGEKSNLPDEGEMTIRFKKTRTENFTPDGEKPRHSCTLEVREIVGIGESKSDDDAPAKNHNRESGDALDRLRDEKRGKGKSEY